MAMSVLFADHHIEIVVILYDCSFLLETWKDFHVYVKYGALHQAICIYKFSPIRGMVMLFVSW